MARLYVIQRGRTAWDDQGRMENLAGVSLSPQGAQEIHRLCTELAGRDVKVIYTSPVEAEQQSAKMLGEALRLRIRHDADLAGVDYGLWQGLTGQDIRRGDARLYRHWLSRPAQVRPPGGETLGQTQQRLCGAVGGICRRHRRQGVLLVLGPVAVALLRAAMEHVELDRLWELVQPAASWSSYDTDGQFS